jgi:hypothetical protein
VAGHGLEERRATLARVKALVGGRVYESALPDDANPPRSSDGKIAPHIILDFGAPVRSARDRNLSNPEKGQPHVLPVNAACIAGDADAASVVSAALFDLLVDWAPSETSDPYEAKGGYGGKRPATGNTPTRYVSGSFFECVTNQGVDGPF